MILLKKNWTGIKFQDIWLFHWCVDIRFHI